MGDSSNTRAVFFIIPNIKQMDFNSFIIAINGSTTFILTGSTGLWVPTRLLPHLTGTRQKFRTIALKKFRTTAMAFGLLPSSVIGC
jgi:hypothetical protein